MALPAPLSTAERIRVLVVDDSLVIRGLVVRWLDGESDIEVVGKAVNGEEAIERARTLKPHVIILDVEMPVMDGITALPRIHAAAPFARIVMASTLTRQGAAVTIRALSLGAADYIAKPDAGQIAGAEDYRRELLVKIRGLGSSARRTASAVAPRRSGQLPTSVTPFPRKDVILGNKTLKAKPEALFIGASTGGPAALGAVVASLVGKVTVPVFITQHMPAMFTAILAEHMAKATGAKVVEAKDGMAAEAGTFYIAPGDFHMTVQRRAGRVFIVLDQSPPENFCRPAVDPLFRSAAAVYGERAFGVVLTGMGHDGREGARALAGKGGLILAQDEATSVVWGMPGAVATAGLACAIKPIADIGPTILNVLRGVNP
jgi:two-component system, chemotaxis family, protein-glutamate methylesterase/glutaminase